MKTVSLRRAVRSVLDTWKMKGDPFLRAIDDLEAALGGAPLGDWTAVDALVKSICDQLPDGYGVELCLANEGPLVVLTYPDETEEIVGGDCGVAESMSKAMGMAVKDAAQRKSVIEDAYLEAIRRFESGEKPGFSTGICESLTCGYGTLDDLGYWEFPLPRKYWDKVSGADTERCRMCGDSLEADHHQVCRPPCRP
jgi:hypothetical protein